MNIYPRGRNQTVVAIYHADILFSYQTAVAAATDGRYLVTEEFYSRTTSRHIADWFTARNVDQDEVEIVPQEDLDRMCDTPAELASMCDATA